MSRKTKLAFALMATSIIGCNRMDTIQPQQRAVIEAVFASGYIILENEYKVTAKTEGYLIKSYVNEGQKVASGMPLFQLSNDVQIENLASADANYKDALRQLSEDSPEQAQLMLQIDQAKAQLEIDQVNFERHKKLVDTEAVSKRDFENAQLQFENSKANVALKEKALADLRYNLELNLKNSKAQLIIQETNNADHFLHSNIEGEVLQIYKQPGDLVMKGETVALVGGGHSIARLNIAEEDILDIAIGQEVVVRLNILKDEPLRGTIQKIYPSFDDVDQSFIAEAEFEEDYPSLLHNSQLQANIIVDQKESALVIPSHFLIEGDSVYLVGGEVQAVRVGLRNEQWVEILDGISPEHILQNPFSL